MDHAEREVDGIFAVYAGMPPSILDDVSVVKGRPEWAWAELPHIFPRMDGA